MKLTPENVVSAAFTRSQANAVCKGYQHLVGTEYTGNEFTGTIECVCVAPFDDVNKYIFMEFYRDCRNAEKALEFYLVPFFDVVVIIRHFKNNKLAFARVRNAEHVSEHAVRALSSNN